MHKSNIIGNKLKGVRTEALKDQFNKFLDSKTLQQIREVYNGIILGEQNKLKMNVY